MNGFEIERWKELRADGWEALTDGLFLLFFVAPGVLVGGLAILLFIGPYGENTVVFGHIIGPAGIAFSVSAAVICVGVPYVVLVALVRVVRATQYFKEASMTIGQPPGCLRVLIVPTTVVVLGALSTAIFTAVNAYITRHPERFDAWFEGLDRFLHR